MTVEARLADGSRVGAGDRGTRLVAELQRQHGFTLPVIAGMVETLCPRGKFIDILRDAPYEDFPFYRVKTSVAAQTQLRNDVATQNKTLAAVSALCAVCDERGSKFRRNSQVTAIINTNFDSILTAYIKARYGESLIRTIDRPSASPSRRRINTYHVHGFMDFGEDKIGRASKEAPGIGYLRNTSF